MSIIRVRKNANYFSASNEPFNDKRLSWESRGLMGYLLSKADGWEIRMEDLKEQGKAKDHKIRRMLAELQMCGYVNRIRISMPGGTFDWTSEVYESPSQNPKPQTSMRFSTSGSSTRGKSPDILSTKEEEAVNVFSVYQTEIGIITLFISDALSDWEKDVPGKWIVDAIHEAAANNKRNWKYVEAILKRWKAQGNQETNKKNGNQAESDRPEYQKVTHDPAEEAQYVPNPNSRTRTRANGV